MRTIYKYPLEIADFQEIEMPVGSTVLTVQIQNRQLCLWAEVFPERIIMKRRIHIFGTGQKVPDHIHRYVGTFQLLDGQLIYHVYEEI